MDKGLFFILIYFIAIQYVSSQNIGITINDIKTTSDQDFSAYTNNADTAFIVGVQLAEIKHPDFIMFIDESISKAQSRNNELGLIRLKALKAQKELEVYGIKTQKQDHIINDAESNNSIQTDELIKPDISESVADRNVEETESVEKKEEQSEDLDFDIDEVIRVNPGNKLKVYAQAAKNYFEKDAYEEALEYSQLWWESAEEEQDITNIIDAKNMMGELSRLFGLSAESIQFHQDALKLSEEQKDNARIAYSHSNLGALHASIDNFDEALESLNKALEVQIANNIPKDRNIIYQRRAKLFLKQKQAQKAIKEIEACSEHCRKMNNLNNVIVNENIIGDIHKDNQELTNSLLRYEKSFQLSGEYQKQSLLAMNYADLGILANEKKQYNKAVESCKKGYEIAKKIKHEEFLSNNCSCLYTAYKVLGNADDALKYYEEHKALKDKIYDTEQLKKVSRLQATFQYENEITEKDYEIKLLEEKKREQNLMLTILGLLAALLVGIACFIYRNLHLKNRYNNELEDKNDLLEEQKVIIQKEKDKTEELLLNILPAETAKELKEKGSAETKEYKNVSILFSDFVGFTEMSEKLSAKELVKELNHCFNYFDELMDELKLEKIKTIGDAYMCVSGLPNPDTASSKNIVLAGLAMQKFIENRKMERKMQGLPAFEMRVGIHTGPVVAGIVGSKKFQYDIWGDTVNIASRMESNGDVGKVNISKVTHKLIEYDDSFECKYRGHLKVKGKGDMEMYFVEG